jgi:hypothetical protein
VVQKKDGIQLTQTDPVAYQEKAKEEIEGKKGPPAPFLELFPKEKFLAEGPMEETKEEILLDEEAPLTLWEEEEALLLDEETAEGEELETGEGVEGVAASEMVKEAGLRDDSLEESVSTEEFWWEEGSPAP